MAKVQENIYGMKTQQGVLLSDVLVVEKIYWGGCKFSSDIGRMRLEVCRFPHGVFHRPLLSPIVLKVMW